MNKAILALAGVALAAAVAAGAYQLGVKSNAASPSMTASASVSADAAVDPKTGRKVLYWHDPMVPGHKFDKPGKSPFMDMQLVPVYADEAGDEGVKVSPSVAHNLGIRTIVVRKGELRSAIDAVGVVAQNERATEVVQSRVTGYIEKLHVRAVLDPVRKGQPLVTVFAPDWAAALEEYLGIKRARVDDAWVDAARARLRLLSIPDEVVTRSEQAGSAQTHFTLSAPLSGVVAELGVRDGAMVAPGMTLFRIADLSSVWVVADVPEALASQVRIGQSAEVLIAGGKKLTGKLSAVLPDVDASTRTLKARLEVRNPGLKLKPGMFVRVALQDASTNPVLLVPQEAVIATGRRNVVVVAQDDGRYTPVEVELGHASGADVEVKAGLTEGQRVVSSGQFLLDSEASLKSGLARLEAAAPQAAAATWGRHSGEGTLEAIDKESLTISHGPIPSIQWGAMTMPFRNPTGGLPPGLKVGDRVRFDFMEKDGEYELQAVTRVDAGAER